MRFVSTAVFLAMLLYVPWCAFIWHLWPPLAVPYLAAAPLLPVFWWQLRRAGA